MTAIRRNDFARLIARWDAGIRLLLLAGPDEAASAEFGRKAVAALADADDPMGVTDITADALRSDPGRLADEAAATSMFGGRRVIRVTGAGDSTKAAVELLLDAAATENPVVMEAGNLTKASALRKLAEKSPAARILLSYPLDARDAQRALMEEARALGLHPEQGVVGRLIVATGGDAGILRAELEKFALYLDATPDAPQPLDSSVVDALGARIGDEDLGTLIDAITAEKPRIVGRELAGLVRTSAIPALRRMARRLLQLLDARDAMDRGLPPEDAIRSLRPPVFWKETGLLAAALPRWPAGRCRAGIEAMLAAEQAIKAPGSAGDTLGWQALLTLARPTSR